MKRVAVVTGANQGIGLAIVRGLCKQFPGGEVILTAIDEELGRIAMMELAAEGITPKFFVLDITKDDQIENLKAHLVKTYGGLDVLINNAGASNQDPSQNGPLFERAQYTVGVNFWGTLNVCKGLFSILREHARVVHVSSRLSTMALGLESPEYKQFSKGQCSPALLAKLKACRTVADVEKYMTQYVEATRLRPEEVSTTCGWPNMTYCVSKMGVTLMTSLQQEEFDRGKTDDIVVNSCCPGPVRSDMNKQGTKTAEEGADTPIYLALLPLNSKSPRGEFVAERQILKWR